MMAENNELNTSTNFTYSLYFGNRTKSHKDCSCEIAFPPMELFFFLVFSSHLKFLTYNFLFELLIH